MAKAKKKARKKVSRKKTTRRRCCPCPRKRATKKRTTRRKRTCTEVRVVCPARRYGKKVHQDERTGRCYVKNKSGSRRYVKRVKKCVSRKAKAGRFDTLGRQIRR